MNSQKRAPRTLPPLFRWLIVKMNSTKRALRTLPPLFRWLFPFQAPGAAVAIYAAAYAFGVESTHFILPVVAVSSAGPVHTCTEDSLTRTRLACMSSWASSSASLRLGLDPTSHTSCLAGSSSALASGAVARWPPSAAMSPANRRPRGSGKAPTRPCSRRGSRSAVPWLL